MIDHVKITVRSGNGGNGCISFRREKFVPRGGPDGGDGGEGGSVYIRADPQENTLLSFRYRRLFVAGDGENGRGKKMHGRSGVDAEIRVPVGTEVWECGEEKRLIVDLDVPGKRVEVVRGGRGGRGNTWFATSTRQVPLLAEAGEEGREAKLQLQLKLLADVAIVGKPNVGKSTLLSVVSRARPKIADYPFTTTSPVLGVVEVEQHTFVMADIPGLIEGAHRGVGLGHEFLRHAERVSVVLHLLDGASEDVRGSWYEVNEELRLYKETFAEKPRVIAVNKIDLPDVREKMPKIKKAFAKGGVPLFFISAATGEGVRPLLAKLLEVVNESRQTAACGRASRVGVLHPRPSREKVEVSRESGVFVVSFSRAARLAAMANLSDWMARLQLYRELERMGVVKALEEAGVAQGDVVRIGKVELEWQ